MHKSLTKVAICNSNILIFRNQYVGIPVNMQAYKFACAVAQRRFFQYHWPCEAKHPRKGACANYSFSHKSAIHQNKDGRRFQGNFQSKFLNHRDLEAIQTDTFLEEVNKHLGAIVKKMQARQIQDGSRLEKRTAFLLHIEQTMSRYVWAWNRDSSHSTCFSCLMSVPEHALPCGHIICHQCFVLLSTDQKSSSDHELEIESCPLCCNMANKNMHMKISIKPRTAGLRILSLDGYYLQLQYARFRI